MSKKIEQRTKKQMAQLKKVHVAHKNPELPKLSGLTREQQIAADAVAADQAGEYAKELERRRQAVTIKNANEKLLAENEVKARAEIRTLANEIITGTVKVAGTYLRLCKYIRENQIAPKIATSELLECGFHKVKVSEIVRIAHASDANWSEFEAGTASIKNVLAMERGTVQKLIADEISDGDVVDIKAQVEEHSPQAALVKSEDEKQADLKKRVENAALAILKWGLSTNTKAKEWTTGDGFTLRLSRDVDYKIKQAQKKLAAEQAAAEKKADAASDAAQDIESETDDEVAE